MCNNICARLPAAELRVLLLGMVAGPTFGWLVERKHTHFIACMELKQWFSTLLIKVHDLYGILSHGPPFDEFLPLRPKTCFVSGGYDL